MKLGSVFHLCSIDWKRNKDPLHSPAMNSILNGLKNSNSIITCPKSFNINPDCTVFEYSTVERIVEEILSSTMLLKGKRSFVGFGVYIWNEIITERLIGSLRRRGFDGIIMLGGPSITFAGKEVKEKFPGADVFIRGYAENILQEVLCSDSEIPLPGVVWRNTPDNYDLCKELDSKCTSFPYLNNLGKSRFLWWETKRGCPFRCSFCMYSSLKENRIFEFDLDVLKQEVHLMKTKMIEDVKIIDPIFNMGSNYLAVLDEFISTGSRCRISAEIRPELITEEFAEKCSHLNIILELGLQTINEAEWELIDRRNIVSKIEEALRLINKYQVDYQVTLMSFLPKQNISSLKDSIRFCLSHGVPRISINPLNLYPGTKIYNQRHDWGYKSRYNLQGIPTVFQSNWLGDDELAKAFRNGSITTGYKRYRWERDATGAYRLAKR